ncbi:MAG: single-stranded-DNA-specific exonuclease RecJ [Anaerolineales bacterium]|nr:single-stranded-DNA-specific exonuclease RecJ [Anaerolineales bacterium]
MNQMPEKNWQVAKAITPEQAAPLQKYPPLLQQILFNRGYLTQDQAERYLNAQAPPGTQPENLLGIPAAVDRILQALDKKEPIVIYGDYDADGVTATALLTSYLQAQGGNVQSYIPNRFDEGYGLNIEALTSLIEQHTSLVITVDCGIRSLEETEFARQQGLDLIITDHHQPGPEIPSALAVIDPKQPHDNYPEKELAGVGLAYKLCQALDQQLRNQHVHADEYLDLVALGTVADLAPLTGENRALVRQGIELLRRPYRQGILSLIGVANINQGQLTASDIGYTLGPRINAAGRLDSALAALELLTSRDVSSTSYLAQQLEIQNRERQRITRAIQERAEQIALDADPEAFLMFAIDPDFNSGVVGLAASRLTEHYYRPAIVGQQGEAFTRASCRSIPEFHITNALDQCAELLENHGGHAAAAGFTARNEHVPELYARLKALAQEQLQNIDLSPTLYADVEVPLRQLTYQVFHLLQMLEPTGHGNRRPIFVSRNLQVKSFRPVGSDRSHLKLTVSDGTITFDAIAFRQGHWAEHMPARIDLLYTFEENEFRGTTSLQLNVRDLKAS